MGLSLYLTIFFGLIGAVGLGASIYYGKKSKELERSKVSLDFEDLSVASSDIADFLKSEEFHPDIVYTPGAKSAILAELLSQKFTHEPLVVVGAMEWKGTGVNHFETGSSSVIDNNKWRIFIPDIVLANKGRKIVLVDDIAMSGDGFSGVVANLLSNGFKKENIKTSTLVCTSVAIASKKSPDYYWRKTDSTIYYFPWGKTR